MPLYFLNMFKPNIKVSHITSYDNTSYTYIHTTKGVYVSFLHNVTLLQGHKNLLNLLLYSEIKLINLFETFSTPFFGNKTVFLLRKNNNLNFFFLFYGISRTRTQGNTVHGYGYCNT